MSDSQTYSFYQIRGTNNTNNKIQNIEVVDYIHYVNEELIIDKKIVYNFLPNHFYYLTFNVNKNIRILLHNSLTEDSQLLYIKDIEEIVNYENQNNQIELMITPDNDYDEIYFIAQRNNYNNSLNNMIIENINFYQLVNICDRDKEIKKIGIQSIPGSLFCINKDKIKIGKNGIFQINNKGVNVTFIAPIPSNNINNNYYIIDCLYLPKEV